jgi:hypothetical protein
MNLIVAAALLWHIVIIPSNSNRLVDLPETYATEDECITDVGPPVRSRIEVAVQAYVAANGGDTTHTRAYCAAN